METGCVWGKNGKVTLQGRIFLFFFSLPSKINLEHQHDFSTTHRYISDDPVFRFVSLDAAKRGAAASSAPSPVVVHTSAQFGEESAGKTASEVAPALESHLRRTFPWWPRPAWVKCHRWRFSQVVVPYPGSPGAAPLFPGPILLAAGDALAGRSGFNGCADSAVAAQRLIMN